PQQPQIVVVQQGPPQVTAPNAAPPPPPKDDDRGQVDVGEPTAANPGAATRQGMGVRPKASVMPSASAAAVAAAPLDTQSFVPNVPGPAATAAPQGNAGGSQLSQGEMQAVVAQNQAIIKRKCWIPALEAKPPNAPSNARVVGSLTIGASGAVESASTSG